MASRPRADVTNPVKSVMRLQTKPVTMHSIARLAFCCDKAATGSGATAMAMR